MLMAGDQEQRQHEIIQITNPHPNVTNYHK